MHLALQIYIIQVVLTRTTEKFNISNYEKLLWVVANEEEEEELFTLCLYRWISTWDNWPILDLTLDFSYLLILLSLWLSFFHIVIVNDVVVTCGSVLAEKLNLNYEEAERWIVNLVRTSKLDAKIDSKTGTVLMEPVQPNV